MSACLQVCVTASDLYKEIIFYIYTQHTNMTPCQLVGVATPLRVRSENMTAGQQEPHGSPMVRQYVSSVTSHYRDTSSLRPDNVITAALHICNALRNLRQVGSCSQTPKNLLQ